MRDMRDYYNLLRDIRRYGHDSDDRTGVGTLSLFGEQMKFDLRKGFPLLTGKYTPFKLIAAELLWFLSGSTNNESLRRLNGNDKPTIWEEWAIKLGHLGPIYGYQWRSWFAGTQKFDTAMGEMEETVSIDQIKELIDGLIKRPFSRRHIVSAWNVADLPDETKSPQENVFDGKMALAPCHCLFQFYVRKLTAEEILKIEPFRAEVPKYALSCRLDQRSADFFLGVPFNIASYALLTHMIAHVTNMVPEELIWQGGDCHIYKNHLKQVDELLSRDVSKYPLPRLEIKRKIDSIDDFKLDDFEIVDYQSFPAIKAPVAV